MRDYSIISYTLSFIDTVYQVLSEWHFRDLTIFDYQDTKINLDSQCIDIIKLNAYSHYQMWHLLEGYDFNVGRKHNLNRNNTINWLNQFYNKYNPTNAKYYNTEGIGSLIDKININNIKYLHALDNHECNIQIISDEKNILLDCLTSLLTNMIDGEIGYRSPQILKINYTYKDPSEQYAT